MVCRSKARIRFGRWRCAVHHGETDCARAARCRGRVGTAGGTHHCRRGFLLWPNPFPRARSRAGARGILPRPRAGWAAREPDARASVPACAHRGRAPRGLKRALRRGGYVPRCAMRTSASRVPPAAWGPGSAASPRQNPRPAAARRPTSAGRGEAETYRPTHRWTRSTTGQHPGWFRRQRRRWSSPQRGRGPWSAHS